MKKEDFIKWIPLAVVAFVTFLCIYYWQSAVDFISLLLGAASGIFLGLIMAFLVNILMSGYESSICSLIKKIKKRDIKRSGLIRVVSLILAYSTIIALIVVMVWLVVPEFVNSFVKILTTIKSEALNLLNDEKIRQNKYIGKYASQISKSIPAEDDLVNYIQNIGTFLMNGFSGLFSSMLSSASEIVNIVAKVFIGFALSIYVLIDKEKLAAQCKGLLKVYFPKSKNFVNVAQLLNNNFKTFFRAQVTDAAIVGILCMLGMFLFRLPYPVMVGMIIGFTAIVPVIGPMTGEIISIIFILTVSPIKAFMFFIFITVLQQIDNTFLYPRVVGKSIDLPGMFVFTSVAVGGSLFGLVGMICAVPLTATAYKLIKSDYRHRIVVKNREDKRKKREDSKHT